MLIPAGGSMEIAYTTTATPLGEALARDVEDARKKEQQTQSASIGDTVSISEEGREKQRAQASGESGGSANDKEGASDFGGNSALGKGTAVGGSAGSAGEKDPETEVEKIQREIRDVQTKITDANNRLAAAQSRASMQAQSPAAQEQGAAANAQKGGTEGEEMPEADLGSATPPMPGAAIAKGDEEVQSIQAELTQLTNELMRLYEKLQDAQKSAGGGAAGVSAG